MGWQTQSPSRPRVSTASSARRIRSLHSHTHPAPPPIHGPMAKFRSSDPLAWFSNAPRAPLRCDGDGNGVSETLVGGFQYGLEVLWLLILGFALSGAGTEQIPAAAPFRRPTRTMRMHKLKAPAARHGRSEAAQQEQAVVPRLAGTSQAPGSKTQSVQPSLCQRLPLRHQ